MQTMKLNGFRNTVRDYLSSFMLELFQAKTVVIYVIE